MPSHKVCCTSQLAVNCSVGNTWDTRLSKHPMPRRARLKPIAHPQGLAAPKAYKQWMGEGEWVWTMLQSFEPNAEGCYLGTSCPAKGASHVHASSPALTISASLLDLIWQSISGQTFPRNARRSFSACWKSDRLALEKNISGVQKEKGEQESIHNLYDLLISEFKKSQVRLNFSIDYTIINLYRSFSNIAHNEQFIKAY